MGRSKVLFINARLCGKDEVNSGAYDLASTYWHPAKNTHVDLQRVGTSEERQCYFFNKCKRHLTFQSPKSVLSNWKTSLDCRVCGLFRGKTREPSHYEQVAYGVMQNQLHLKDDEWLVDIRVLKGAYSSADVWIPKLRLMLMIDGEGHFGDMHADNVQVQQARDDRFNVEALKQGHRVLRLHYLDVGLFREVIQAIVNLCIVFPTSNFVEFSKHYKRSIMGSLNVT